MPDAREELQGCTESINHFDFGPQNSRSFRALKSDWLFSRPEDPILRRQLRTTLRLRFPITPYAP